MPPFLEPSLSVGAGQLRCRGRRTGARCERPLHFAARPAKPAKRSDGSSAPRASRAARFEGYTSADDTERKILRNVFEDGDAWYRTGDLMRMDAAGFFYFVDRIGDTFRWKGENVATSEVAAALLAFPGIAEASVYGVAVPRHRRHRPAWRRSSPKARSISPNCAGICQQRLPAYARPLFLRIKDRIELTATFKQKKNELIREGFDPATISDAVYFDDPERQAYLRLDDALFQRIETGQIRV